MKLTGIWMGIWMGIWWGFGGDLMRIWCGFHGIYIVRIEKMSSGYGCVWKWGEPNLLATATYCNITSTQQLRLWTACASLCTYIDTNSNQHVPCVIFCAMVGHWQKLMVGQLQSVGRISLHYLLYYHAMWDPRKSCHTLIFGDHVCFPYRSSVVSEK